MAAEVTATICARSVDSHTKNLYYTEHAAGSFLTRGLRRYQYHFETARLNHSEQKFVKAMITVGQIALGIFAYPLLGTLALLGLAINELHLLGHNSGYKRWFKYRLKELNDSSSGSENLFQRQSTNLPAIVMNNRLEARFERSGSEAIEVYGEGILALVKNQINDWSKRGVFIAEAKLSHQPPLPGLLSTEMRLSADLVAYLPDHINYEPVYIPNPPSDSDKKCPSQVASPAATPLYTPK